MPVKWILHWQPNLGTTVSTQTLTEVCQCVESIHGSKDGRWKATLTYYKPMLRGQPGKYYFIIRSHRIILEAESSIQIIMEKIQSYKSRVSLNYEVEYLPISSLEKSKRILEDFVDISQEIITKKSLPGHFIPIEPNFGEYGLSDRYNSQHTAIQYAAAMAHLIASGRN
ncbi:Mediator of RNA polymerase II transcription subunit 20a [Acorus calamus]|uniref:Mediator of RNA polymerase II transcription subunit 20 n=1 Tax=Acorus calamus TaxID=4465 RepID=A0AAV9DLU9_ACOCL|nr:Mediator of RNA polymerase II transcription subunit 20a [Acorus calamus]